MSFTELVRLLHANGFRIVREKRSIRYCGRGGWPQLVRVDFHGSRQVPRGTPYSILKAAGIARP